MRSFDAIVVGGGPGGSLAGATLARAGKRVLLLEKERFPRFHIGESLLPYGNDPLREVGVWDKVRAAGFVVKPGAEFTMGNSHGALRFWFGRNLSEDHATTFQVERSRFDQILLDHARECGCEIAAPSRAESLEIFEDRVTVHYRCGDERITAESPWLIDASGRETFVGRNLQLPKSDLGLAKKFAIFGHFQGVRRNDGDGEGLITIVRLPNAWCWIIPLDAEKTSVGLVQPLATFKAGSESPEDCLQRTFHEHAELRFRMGSARLIGEVHATGDYTYRFRRSAGKRWMLVGDAAGFIDPIFSSGVTVAMTSGHLAARTILAARSTDGLTRAAQSRYTRRIHRMTTVFLRMIRMFYDNRAFEVFMNPSPVFGLTRAVVNLIGGNTRLDWRLRWTARLFYLLCWLQRYLPVAPRLHFGEVINSRPLVPSGNG